MLDQTLFTPRNYQMIKNEITDWTMNQITRHLFLFIGLTISISGYAQTKCDWSVIDDASEKYQTGNFDEAIELVQKCLANGFDDKQKVQAYRIMAKSYLEQDNDSLAIQLITALLSIDQQFQPDYLTDPTRFIEILQSIKDKNSTQQITSVSKKSENIKEAPAAVMLLTAKDIKARGYLDLEAILHDLPGFDISRSNGNLYTHVYQRGYRSINTNRTLFLIDGIEDNDLWSSNVYLSRQYALSNIKNIEIVYGPASTMYGSNAFLGVINIITKEPWEMINPGKLVGVNARVAYGSYNTKFADISMAARTKNNNISFSLTGRLFLSDEQDLSSYQKHSYEPREMTSDRMANYHTKLDIIDDTKVATFLATHPSSGTYYNLDADNNIILTDEGINQALAYDNEVYNNVSFSDYTKAYLIESKLKIYDFLIGYSYWNKAEGPGAQYNDNMFMGYDQGQSWRPVHTHVYAKYEKNITNKFSISNLLSYKDHDFDKDNSIVRYRKNYSTGNFTLDNLINGKVPTFDSLYLFQKSSQMREEMKVLFQPLKWIDAIAGFELRFSNIQGDYSSSSKNNAEQSGAPQTDIPGGNHFFTRDIGIYAQTTLTPISHLKITLGLRYDNNLVRENEGYGNAFNPRIALVYSLKGYTVKAIYAEAFKDATNREKYSTAAGKRELSNPTLQPEKVKNYEFAIGKDFGELINVEAAAYFAQYSNIIQELQTTKPDGTLTNQNQAKGNAEVYGINATSNLKWNDLTCYLNYTYTIPYTIKPTDSQGNPVLNENLEPYEKLRISDIANHRINFGANYLFKNVLNFNLRTNFVSERITGENTTVPANHDTFNPYFILNGALSYSPKKTGLTAQFTIFNILNAEYFDPGLDQVTPELASSLKQNGRNMYLSLIYEF